VSVILGMASKANICYDALAGGPHYRLTYTRRRSSTSHVFMQRLFSKRRFCHLGVGWSGVVEGGGSESLSPLVASHIPHGVETHPSRHLESVGIATGANRHLRRTWKLWGPPSQMGLLAAQRKALTGWTPRRGTFLPPTPFSLPYRQLYITG